MNIVGFAPDLVDEGDAHTATGIAGAYVSALRARRPWWRRALWSVSPRPLWWWPRLATPPHHLADAGAPVGPGTPPPAFLRPARPEPLTAAAFPPFPGPPAPAQWPTAPPAAAPVAPDGGYAHTGEHQQYAAPGERFSPLERDGSVSADEHGRHRRGDEG